MRKSLLTFVGAVFALSAVPASANVVFSDNFDTDNGGATALNFTGFNNFNSTGGGFVDLVHTGDGYGINCAGARGGCVDLDGSPGPGEIRSINSFAFNAGDFVRLSFDISGNQRGGANDIFQTGFQFSSGFNMINYGTNFGGVDLIAFPGTLFGVSGVGSSSSISPQTGFTTKSIFFTAGTSGSLRFSFADYGTDNIGPILDNVSLSIGGAVPEPATWAMLITGFGLIGGAMRRKAKTQVTYA